MVNIWWIYGEYMVNIWWILYIYIPGEYGYIVIRSTSHVPISPGSKKTSICVTGMIGIGIREIRKSSPNRHSCCFLASQPTKLHGIFTRFRRCLETPALTCCVARSVQGTGMVFVSWGFLWSPWSPVKIEKFCGDLKSLPVSSSWI